MITTTARTRANKTNAGNGSKAICRVSNVLRSPSPDPKRWVRIMKRYSAMLLFQYRADFGNGRSDVMRRCEERLIVLFARNAESALRKAKAHGKKSEFDGKAEAGNPLLFEFVGVKDLLELEGFGEEEVWYDIRTLKLPMERREKLIPPEEKLTAIFWERRNKTQKNPNKGRLATASPSPAT